ncbi:MAG: lysylphosphatidylglycerol synthase transmembrane domain-containing protein [Eubacteriales bacterium]|nr:lysylphosphatidylglycerol synthase transmembrane domain-containing protein [Eubacteriales bacterium]MDD3883099.1 lysylphosphatidylglycerol synthase transmembrane domain-containing protein [Eubacteriales bacterium]MDD4513331.1 lysylphosphatidylglycerol synthase transmembrane domain-containing protein [Eubacteriales bacterium]
MTEGATKKQKLKQVWQYAYIALTVILLLALGFFDKELGALFSGGTPISAKWLAAGGLSLLGFYAAQTAVYDLSARMVGARVSLWRSFRVMMFGEYYSAITPLASGGQPMQLGYYKRYGVSAARGASILALRYIGYVSSICLLCVISFFIIGEKTIIGHPVLFSLTAVGFAVNLASMIMAALLLLRPSLAGKVALFAVRLITRLPMLKKKKEKWEAGTLNSLGELADAADCVRRHPLTCLGVMLLSLASVVSQFSAAYIVYRAVGLSGAAYPELFSMQIFLFLAVAFAPTPGAAGVTEGGFYLFFAGLFPKPMLYGSMLLWRLITYYSSLIFGAALVIFDELAAVRKSKRKPKLETISQPAEESIGGSAKE